MLENPPIAQVVVDIPARALSEPFDYTVPAGLAAHCGIGCPVAVPLGTRRCVGYVVALGSSSTQGYGASTPFHSYPAELLRTLQQLLPGVKVTVYNKGIGGQEVSQMLDRLERDVFAVEPDLVVWQVGTNAALRAQNVAEFRRLLAGGIDRMRAKGIEVVLMTPQFAPAFNALENEQEYLAAMAEVAREKGVGVFPRYEIMKYWFETEQMPYARFIARDGLHMNDFGYMCIGRLLAQALEGAIRR